MEQKKNWTRFLIGGVLSIVIFNINISCSHKGIIDCLTSSEFVYINNSKFELETPIGTIQSNGILLRKNGSIGPCYTDASEYLPPFTGSLTIKVDGISCKIYNSTSLTDGEGPLVIANYTSVRISDSSFRFTYTFNDNEFTNLVDCD